MDLRPDSFLQMCFQMLFGLLYTSAAWSYDIVAWLSSGGEWRTWIKTVHIDFPEGRILELGHGPGYIQVDLYEGKRKAFGVDPSRQMSGMASRKLRAIGGPINLCRGRAQRLPFESSSFGTLVSTFPSDYIFDLDTLGEAYRVLGPEGILIIIAYVKITGASMIDIFLRWAFRITGQSNEGSQIRILERFGDAGFDARFDVVQVKRAEVFRIVANKTHDQIPAPD